MQPDIAVPKIEKNPAANQNLCTVAISSAAKEKWHYIIINRGGGGGRSCSEFKLIQSKKN
jgi:hypothetical protein